MVEIKRVLATFIPVAFVIAMVIVLAGCAPPVGDVWCQIERPIRLPKEAVEKLPRAQLVQLVTHNRYGEQHCGWRP